MNPRLALALSFLVLLLSLQLGPISNVGAFKNGRASAALAEVNISRKVETVGDEIHDIAVANIATSTNGTYPGSDVYIQVAVKNQGNLTEGFNVTVYLNQSSKTIIDIYNVQSLGSSDEIVIPFLWKTAGIPPGNYEIVAESSVVEGETNTSNKRARYLN